MQRRCGVTTGLVQRPGRRRARFARWLAWLALFVFLAPVLLLLAPVRVGSGDARVGLARLQARLLLAQGRLAAATWNRRPTLDEVFGAGEGRFRDPWGSEWVMAPGDQRTVFTFRSAGPDRRLHTADDVVDGDARRSAAR